MAPPVPLLALNDVTVRFGGDPIFTGLSVALIRGDNMCLVGRNGGGKSTLLGLLAGEIEPNAGARFLRPGTRVAYLPQDHSPAPEETVADHVEHGLVRSRGKDDSARYRVDEVLARVGLAGARPLGSLSGGEARRAALARALVGDPDVLLLDEPTNHLDLPTIEWLEGELAQFDGALLAVSHDRAFLERISRATLWLDRGRLYRLDKGFADFPAWAEAIEAREARDRHRLERRIVREERWLRRGITARRRRNQGRLARLEELRRQRREWLRGPQPGDLAATSSGRQGKLILEARHLAKSFAAADGTRHWLLRDFSTRVRRGDRIGIIGPNGAGKTTLVRLLIGALAPDGGELRFGAKVEPVYFDQRRESLDPEATLWKTLVPDGGDSIMVGERQRHVVSYLRDFLFDDGQAHQPVKSLSGGERNRLLLARLFARPSDLMALDEPTNDLDMDTLDLLVDVLDEYRGTLFLVSHDRDFLDRLATSVIAMEGDGRAVEYAGGYSDYIAQRPETDGRQVQRRAKAATGRAAVRPKRPAHKLGYKEQCELDRLPGRLEDLEAAVARLERRLADPTYYGRDPRGFEQATRDLARARAELAAAEERWLDLESRRERLEAARDDA